MSTIIKAGNATDGLALTADNTGILELKTGTGSGTTALTLDASQNATFAGTVTTVTGAVYPLVSSTAQTTTSGTTKDFTGIPSTAKRITVMFSGVSTNATSALLIQIGTSSGIENTGYVSSALAIQNGASSSAANTSTAAFLAAVALNLNTEAYTGQVILSNFSGNTWVASGTLANATATRVTCSAGSKTTAAVLDRVRITSLTPDTFDAGSVNILWE